MKKLLLIFILTTISLYAANNESNRSIMSKPLLTQQEIADDQPELCPARQFIASYIATFFCSPLLTGASMVATDALANTFPDCPFIKPIGYFVSGLALFVPSAIHLKNVLNETTFTQSEQKIATAAWQLGIIENNKEQAKLDLNLLALAHANLNLASAKLTTWPYRCIPTIRELFKRAITQQNRAQLLQNELGTSSTNKIVNKSNLIVPLWPETAKSFAVYAVPILAGEALRALISHYIDPTTAFNIAYTKNPYINLAIGMTTGIVYLTEQSCSIEFPKDGGWYKSKLSFTRANELIEKTAKTSLNPQEKDQAIMNLAAAEIWARDTLKQINPQSQFSKHTQHAEELLGAVNTLRPTLLALDQGVGSLL